MVAEPEGAPEATTATESAADAGPDRAAADAVAWLDSSLDELRGALEACGKCIDAGTLEPTVVSSKMNALVMQMMAGGQ